MSTHPDLAHTVPAGQAVSDPTTTPQPQPQPQPLGAPTPEVPVYLDRHSDPDPDPDPDSGSDSGPGSDSNSGPDAGLGDVPHPAPPPRPHHVAPPPPPHHVAPPPRPRHHLDPAPRSGGAGSGAGAGGRGPGWLARVVRDPGALPRRLHAALMSLVSVYGPILGEAGLTLGALALAGAAAVSARRRARGASWVEITAGPQVDPEGAELLWRILSGLARPRWARLRTGQPHLVWEIHAGASALRLGVWVPSAIRVGTVTGAISAAWPGARTTVTPIPDAVHKAGPRTAPRTGPGLAPHPVGSGRGPKTARVWPVPIPRRERGQSQAIAAGRVYLARPAVLPLRTGERADPLRALLGALETIREHPLTGDDTTESTDATEGADGSGGSASLGWGCVQICVRPVAGWRAALTREAARRILVGASPGLASALGGGTASGGAAGLVGAVLLWVLRGCGLAVREVLRGLGSVAGTPLGGHGGHGTRHGGDRHREYGGPGGLDRSRRSSGRGPAPAISRAVHAKTDHGPYWAVQIRYAASLALPIPVHRTFDPEGSHGGIDPAGGGSGWVDEIAAQRVSRATRVRVDGWADGVGAAFAALTGPNLLRRTRVPQRRARGLFNQRRMGYGQLWSVPELAALAHLPLSPRVPGLTRAGAAAVAAPPGIPTGGRDTRPIGRAQVSGRPVALPVSDARHHGHVIGVTGVGKSWFLAGSALADISAGRAVIALDPKGDLAADIAARIPAADRDRLIMLDPTLDRQPPVINLLDPRYPAGVEHLVGIFARLFGDNWGPRTDDIARAGALSLRAHHRYLLARATLRVGSGPGSRAGAAVRVPVPHLGDLLRVLSDPEVRRGVVAALVGPSAEVAYLRTFWRGFDLMPASSQSAVIAPLANKLRALLLRPFPAAVLTGTPYHHHDPAHSNNTAAGPSTDIQAEIAGAGLPGAGSGRELDMTAVLDRGGILLARLPEGLLSSETTRLLGSLVVAHTWHALTARAARGEHERPDASLYLDEAQMFLHMPVRIEELLAQARAYHLSVTLAHQNLAQLSVELRAALSANALNKFYLRCAPEDATALERHVTPNLGAHDLAHLEPYTLAARLHLSNNPTPAFTVHTYPLPPRTDTTNHDSTSAATSSPATSAAGSARAESGAELGRAA